MKPEEICAILNERSHDGAINDNCRWKYSPNDWFYRPNRPGIKLIDAERIALSYTQAKEIEKLKDELAVAYQSIKELSCKLNSAQALRYPAVVQMTDSSQSPADCYAQEAETENLKKEIEMQPLVTAIACELQKAKELRIAEEIRTVRRQADAIRSRIDQLFDDQLLK